MKMDGEGIGLFRGLYANRKREGPSMLCPS